jgi:hypothetical protein
MESFPRQFRRVNERVKAFEGNAFGQKHRETAKNGFFTKICFLSRKTIALQ